MSKTKATLDELAAELEAFTPREKNRSYSATKRRLILGFKDILHFVQKAQRLPRNHEGVEIFERIYAVRLQRLRENPEALELLGPLDTEGLLDPDKSWAEADKELSIDAVADELGELDSGDLGELRHVRPSAERLAADEVAQRERCEDFDDFAPIFEQVRADLKTGIRETISVDFSKNIDVGDLF